jgi:hypothetical protein
MVSPTTTREALNVAVTRGKAADFLMSTPTGTRVCNLRMTARPLRTPAKELLVGVVRNESADLAAHDTIRRSQSEAESILRLCAEYQTIAKAAEADRGSHSSNAVG